MSQSLSINGTTLHEVRMPGKSDRRDVFVLLTCPKDEVRFVCDEDQISIAVPSFLAVEIYRVGILPQNREVPVAVKVSGRSVGWFVVTDVGYPVPGQEPCTHVTFTLSRVPQPESLPETTAPRKPSRRRRDQGTYVTDMSHFPHEASELAKLPAPARKLVSFLSLLIEEATSAFPAFDHDSRIRCRSKGCTGSVRVLLPSVDEPIRWRCPACGHNGVISNWRNVKWNQLEQSDLSQ
jgi:hypothetical protein